MQTNPNVQILQRLNHSSPRGNDKCINYQPELAVETYLHRFLADEILATKYRLVLITGCSGDGKTEFIQWLESVRMGEEISLAEKPVGRYDWIEYRADAAKGDPVYFCTLYDAGMTFEAEDQKPEDLLKDNLEDFEGEEWNQPVCFRIFSINRDHLREFLNDNLQKYPRLSRCVLPAIDDANPDPRPALKEGVLVVDLTFRSPVGDILREEGLEDGCLYTKLVAKLCGDNFWAPCKGCEAIDYCPIYYNISALDPRNGKVVFERLKSLITAFHYRRIFHLTLRDLVSLLISTFVTDLSCDEIIKAGADPEFIFKYLYFNRLFGNSGDFGVLLDEIDIAAVNSPRVDALMACEADLAPDDTSLPVIVIKDLLDSLHDTEGSASYRELTLALRNGRKRRVFFEDSLGDQIKWTELFPYRSYELFDNLAKKEQPTDTELTRRILKQISIRDGLTPLTDSHFQFSLDSTFEQLVTYYSAPYADFELLLPLPRAIAGHREYLPGYLLLRHREKPNIDLRINLDILEYILYGGFVLHEKPDYVPEIKHRLRVFKEKIESELQLKSFLIRTEDGKLAVVERYGLSGGEVRILDRG